jgi:hypothetical protein
MTGPSFPLERACSDPTRLLGNAEGRHARTADEVQWRIFHQPAAAATEPVTNEVGFTAGQEGRTWSRPQQARSLLAAK